MKYYGYNVNGKPTLFRGNYCVVQKGDFFFILRAGQRLDAIAASYARIFQDAIREGKWLLFSNDPFSLVPAEDNAAMD